MKCTAVARILYIPYTAPAYRHTWVRTLPYGYAVVNSTTRNWAHLTSKHPQSPQKMGKVIMVGFRRFFSPLFDFGEESRPSQDFSYFSISFLPSFLGQQLFKVLRKKMRFTVIAQRSGKLSWFPWKHCHKTNSNSMLTKGEELQTFLKL